MNRLFDSDTKALKRREQLNIEGALYNLEDWIIQQVQPYQGMRFLDLGCGTGKQIFALAHLVSPEGFILGLDISAEAVDEVNKRAKREKLNHVKTIKESLDECIDILQDFRFDLILSTYAIYYAKDMKGLLSGLRALLNPNGQVFVCGPGRGTNQEMINLINQATSNLDLKAKAIEDFIQDLDISEMGNRYSRYRTVRLDNQIRFNSPEQVLEWWRNHNSFISAIYEDVVRAVQFSFSQNNEFILTKNVLGVQFYA